MLLAEIKKQLEEATGEQWYETYNVMPCGDKVNHRLVRSSHDESKRWEVCYHAGGFLLETVEYQWKNSIEECVAAIGVDNTRPEDLQLGVATLKPATDVS